VATSALPALKTATPPLHLAACSPVLVASI
jgi:hypothetical protein